MKAVTAAGGVLYRSVQDHCEVALIYRNGVWDLPKGKREAGESVKACARREVAEELGLDSLPSIESFLTETHHEYGRGGQKYHKKTHWFCMDVAPACNFEPQRKEGITQIKWTALNKAYQKVGYKNLLDVLKIFETSINKKDASE